VRPRTVLVVTGLNKEARIAAGPGITAIAGGGSPSGLRRRLDGTDPASLGAVVSFGIAGALDPTLRVGDLVLATAVLGSGGPHSASAPIREAWIRRLGAANIAHREGALAGVDAPLMGAADKTALRALTGAGAVDMESHIAAAFAARHGLPFAVLRVISDAAGHSLPHAAGAAMRPDGSVDVLGVLKSLAGDPSQIPALVATARDAAVAFRQLGRVRRLLDLGGGLVGLDL
jgi:hopanoid-associated phosphorylase